MKVFELLIAHFLIDTVQVTPPIKLCMPLQYILSL